MVEESFVQYNETQVIKFKMYMPVYFVDEWSHDERDEVRSRIKTSRWQEISVQVNDVNLFNRGVNKFQKYFFDAEKSNNQSITSCTI